MAEQRRWSLDHGVKSFSPVIITIILLGLALISSAAEDTPRSRRELVDLGQSLDAASGAVSGLAGDAEANATGNAEKAGAAVGDASPAANVPANAGANVTVGDAGPAANVTANAGANVTVGAGGAALNASVEVGAAATSENGHKVFDVTNYGVKPNDEHTDNSMPLIKAWNAACKSGGPAKLLIPEGTYTTGPVVFQGPCTGSNPIIVEVKGTFKAITDVSLYTDGDWFVFEAINGLEVQGGVWDGQGQTLWELNDCKTNKDCQHLPVSVQFKHVTNGKIEGITSVNSMGFHLSTTFSSHVTLHKVNISAPDTSPNTDGIHVSTTDNLQVTESTIATGDDCLGIIQGATNITVHQVVCGPGHGISIGSLGKYRDEKNVHGVHVSSCTLKNTTNGVRIKSFPSDIKVQVSDIIFEDITMENVKNPVLIDQNYGSKKGSGRASNVAISNVHYRRIKGTTVSVNPVSLTCSSAVPCKSIELADIDLTYSGEKPLPPSSVCENAEIVFSGKQNPEQCKL